MSESTVIQLEGISKVFETEEVRTHALSEITLSIQRGEYVAIAGPSGCGKSTLLSIMGLLDVPSSGQYPPERRTGQRVEREGEGPRPEPADRVHLSELQPAWGSDG